MSKEHVLKFLEEFGVEDVGHGKRNLRAHLTGTYDILKNWGYPESVCIAGLCHSIYGTESFRQTPVALEERERVKSAIGEDSEKLTYYFGAHKKRSLWANLEKETGYTITDRFTETEIALSDEDMASMIALTLANWLEQRPFVDEKHKFIIKDELVQAKRWLNSAAYDAFLEAYELK